MSWLLLPSGAGERSFSGVASLVPEPDFRGCAFINSFGEFGEPAPGVSAAIRKHKDEVRDYLRELVPSGLLADQLFALMEGATVLAAITGDAAEAITAKEAAKVLLR